MTVEDWIFVGAAVVGGIIVGAIASRVVHMVVGSASRPEPVRNGRWTAGESGAVGGCGHRA